MCIRTFRFQRNRTLNVCFLVSQYDQLVDYFLSCNVPMPEFLEKVSTPAKVEYVTQSRSLCLQLSLTFVQRAVGGERGCERS